jgi:hypothetical protein
MYPTADRANHNAVRPVACFVAPPKMLPTNGAASNEDGKPKATMAYVKTVSPASPPSMSAIAKTSKAIESHAARATRKTGFGVRSEMTTDIDTTVHAASNPNATCPRMSPPISPTTKPPANINADKTRSPATTLERSCARTASKKFIRNPLIFSGTAQHNGRLDNPPTADSSSQHQDFHHFVETCPRPPASKEVFEDYSLQTKYTAQHIYYRLQPSHSYPV